MEYTFSIEDELRFSIDIGKMQPDAPGMPYPGIAVSTLQGAVTGFLGNASAVPEE